MQSQPHEANISRLRTLAHAAERGKQWHTAYDCYAQMAAIYEEAGSKIGTFSTLRVMCEFAQKHELWPRAVTAAKALIAFFEAQEMPRPDLQLLLAQAERRCHNIETARNILIGLVRAGEINLREEWPFQFHFSEMHLYASALYEWALLEADEGLIPEALNLMALSELTIDQFENSPSHVNPDREDQHAERPALRALGKTIIADRIRLQAQL